MTTFNDFTNVSMITIQLYDNGFGQWKGITIGNTMPGFQVKQFTIKTNPLYDIVIDSAVPEIRYIWSTLSNRYVLYYAIISGYTPFLDANNNPASFIVNPARTKPLYICFSNMTTMSITTSLDIDTTTVFVFSALAPFIENNAKSLIPKSITNKGPFLPRVPCLPFIFGFVDSHFSQTIQLITNENQIVSDLCFVSNMINIDFTGNFQKSGYISNEPQFFDLGTNYVAYNNDQLSTTFNPLLDGSKVLAVEGVQNLVLINAADFSGTPGFTAIGLILTTTLIPGTTINSQTQTNVSYFGLADGSISLIYTFAHAGSITYSGGNIAQTTILYPNPDPMSDFTFGTENLVLSNLIAGTYTFTISAVGDIDTTFTIVITQPDEFKANFVIPSEGFGCIKVVASGGIPPYTYQWFYCDGKMILCETSNIIQIPKKHPFGKYIVKITDSTGHTISLTLRLQFPLTCIIENIDCDTQDFECSDEKEPKGKLVAKILGSCHPSKYSFTWYNVKDVDCVLSRTNKLIAVDGMYIVLVSDKNTCENNRNTSAIGCISTYKYEKPKKHSSKNKSECVKKH